jgi:hypothetical protein
LEIGKRDIGYFLENLVAPMTRALLHQLSCGLDFATGSWI